MDGGQLRWCDQENGLCGRHMSCPTLAEHGGSGAAQPQPPIASINGIALHRPGERPDPLTLRERAHVELLRQEAVRRGLLPRRAVLEAPTLCPEEQQIVQRMLEESIQAPAPTPQECLQHYKAHKDQYLQGRLVHARHILFAMGDGVDVHKLLLRAEAALQELSRADVKPERFNELAHELSDCPSSAEGGDLGWFGPHDCADELANELFRQKSPLRGIGLHPRLVHSRYGFHILEVLGRKQGRQASFEEVQTRIATQLTQQSRANAQHQYMRVLAGQAVVEGVAIEGDKPPPRP